MALIRWEPARELQSLQQEVNRLFGSVFDTPVNASSAQRAWIPAMDLVEQEDGYVLKADLPGVAKDDIEVQLEDNLLTISGRRSSEHEETKDGYRRIERAYGNFSRSLTLPKGIDAEQIQADFKDGVLELHIPKPEERKPQRVQIGVGTKPAAVEVTTGTDASGSAESSKEKTGAGVAA